MILKAKLFSRCNNLEQLLYRNINFNMSPKDIIIIIIIIIEKIIEISPLAYLNFTSNFDRSYDFAMEHDHLQFIDDSKVWHCILVKLNSLNGGVIYHNKGFNSKCFVGFSEQC